jgi:hypothetical protein
VSKEKDISPEEKKAERPASFWDRYGRNVLLAGMVLYVILLLTGTIAEVFHIDSILNWWIWRPVGK